MGLLYGRIKNEKAKISKQDLDLHHTASRLCFVPNSVYLDGEKLSYDIGANF